MKIYSDTLTIEDLHRACDAIPAVSINDRNGFAQPHIIEGRKRRIEGVTLKATTSERVPDWREIAGVDKRSMPQHATYDEHGRWMAALLDIDPDARIKSAVNDFQGREDFHCQTRNAYRVARMVGFA